jgi:uncharacterized membrane protein YhaH (DUF805 family)
VSPEARVVLALIILPVVAVISLGLLARAFVDVGGSHWPFWLLVLVFSGGVWFYVFTTESP